MTSIVSLLLPALSRAGAIRSPYASGLGSAWICSTSHSLAPHAMSCSSRGMFRCSGQRRSRQRISCRGLSMVTGEEQAIDFLKAQIGVTGDKIRELKSAGVAKDVLAPHIAELLELKNKLAKASGEAQVSTKQPEKIKAKEPKKPLPSPMEGLEQIVMTVDGPVPNRIFGDYKTVASRPETRRKFTAVDSLGAAMEGETVWVRARVGNVRGKGASAFVVLRQEGGATVQAIKFREKGDGPEVEESKGLIKYLAGLPVETVLELQGKVTLADVKSCSQKDVELQILRAYGVSRAEPSLPFMVEDASRPESEVEASQGTDRPFPRLGQEIRLDNRWLDLRVPANNAIMRVQSGVCQLFREWLYGCGFIEIHTPKLVAGESEGGAGVFTTDYFGTTACLAQSPQLYKQMAISADLSRVFEIGPVFRAENSNTRRHLCEFTGLDMEMGVTEHYNEVLRVLHGMFKHIFTGLETRYAVELAAIRKQYDSEPVCFTEEPCIIHWPDAIQLLRDAGVQAEDFDDLSGAQERSLGSIVKEKYGADFFIVDRFPSAIRPFYTMPCPDDSRYSNSYDLFLRGQEICSGAQRCHDTESLLKSLEAKGVPLEPLESYISAFRAACVPHGGAGIGLERVVFLYLGLDNVRKASMFPRDPNRCTP